MPFACGKNAWKNASICTSFIHKSCTHFICAFAVKHNIYIGFCIHACILLLSMTLFVCHFLPPCKVIDGMCLSSCAGYFVHLSASFLVCRFTFIEKFNCDITCTSVTNIVVLVTSIITMLVKLLQMLLGYVSSFVASFSLPPYL